MSIFSKGAVRPPSRIAQSLLGSLAAAVLVLTAACADAPTAATGPSAASAKSNAALLNATILGTTTVTIDPKKSQTYSFGNGNAVQIVAGSVCEPLISGYGATEWDKPCTVITKPLALTITAAQDANGRTTVSFYPDIRFAPDKVNTLWIADQYAAQAASHLNWCPTGALTCVDEATADPSLATTYDPASGLLKRRVKHFSGYNVVFDFSDDGSTTVAP